MKSPHIIGAGMAGLLAANMLRHRNAIISERQKSLPNNHSAVLRFRSGQIGDILGIPFKKVTMAKGYVPWLNPVADSLAYSRKCTGISRSDRSIITTGLETHERYIAPTDLINRMASGLDIEFGVNMNWQEDDAPRISTMPMPSLMSLLDYPNQPEFKTIHGFNIRARLANVDAYVSLYVPSPEYSFNRISITGDELIIEYSYPGRNADEVAGIVELMDPAEDADEALSLLGLLHANSYLELPKAKLQTYSKVMPISEEIRKDFLHWATDKHNIYSLGRFATWRPGLLLDDLVKDIRLIDRWIGDKYAVALHR